MWHYPNILDSIHNIICLACYKKRNTKFGNESLHLGPIANKLTLNSICVSSKVLFID